MSYPFFRTAVPACAQRPWSADRLLSRASMCLWCVSHELVVETNFLIGLMCPESLLQCFASAAERMSQFGEHLRATCPPEAVVGNAEGRLTRLHNAVEESRSRARMDSITATKRASHSCLIAKRGSVSIRGNSLPIGGTRKEVHGDGHSHTVMFACWFCCLFNCTRE